MLPTLLAALEIPRLGQGRPRTRPDALLADKAYSSRGHRDCHQVHDDAATGVARRC